MNLRFWVVVYTIVLFTFGLRVVQIGHGLPDVQMGDENGDLSISLRLLKGELPPVITRYHRTTTSNLELLSIGAVYITQAFKTGDFSVAKFQDLYFSDRGLFVFAVRLLILIIAAIAQIFLADLLAKALSPLTGILAALLAGSYYLWNLHSLYAMPDSLNPSALIFFLWAVLLVLQKGSRLSYAIAGITLAFVMLTKLFNLPIIIALLAAHGFRAWNEGGKPNFWRQFMKWQRLTTFAVALVGSNLILNPWAYVHPMDLITEWQAMSGYMNRDSTYSNFLNPLQIINTMIRNSSLVFSQYIGIILGVTILGGIVAVLVIHKQAIIVLLIAAITIWLTIAIQSFKPSYWISTLPFIVLLSSIGLSSLINWASRKKPLLYSGAAVLVVRSDSS